MVEVTAGGDDVKLLSVELGLRLESHHRFIKFSLPLVPVRTI